MARKRNENHPRTFWADFKLFFLRGLAILLPSVLTLWILVMAYRFVETYVAEPINAGIRTGVLYVVPRAFEDGELPAWFKVEPSQIERANAQRVNQGLRPLSEGAMRTELRGQQFRAVWDQHWYLRVVGLIVAVILIYFAGLLLGGFIGRRLYMRVEQGFARIPLFKSVYPHVKQVVDFLFAQDERKPAFQNVVLVEYPRKGIWTVGLMTGASMKDIEATAAGDCVTIFIPSSPTPFTGYTITVRKEDTIELPITIDEALRFVVTGGVLVPERQAVSEEQLEARRRAGDLASAAPGAMMASSGPTTPPPPEGESPGPPPEEDPDQADDGDEPAAAGDRAERGG